MPGAAGLGGGYYVVVVVAVEDVALGREVFDAEGGEVGAGQVGVLFAELAEELDPEDGDGLVVAAGGGVLAADGEVVGADAGAHASYCLGFAQTVHITGAGEDVGGVRPAGLGEGAVFEGGDEGVDGEFLGG